MNPEPASTHQHPRCSHNQKTAGSKSPASGDNPLPEDDALWSLLGNASDPQPKPFFSQQVTRAAAELESTPHTWLQRITHALTPRRTVAALTVTATACIALLVISFISPVEPTELAEHTQSSDTKSRLTAVAEDSTAPAPNALADLVIQESLLAAAEDPSQFHHDELLAIIGL